MTIALRKTECDFEPGSVVDPVGKVFRHQGRLFRGIYPAYVDSTLTALALAESNHWFDRGLIPTWRTEFTLAGFPLVLEHRRVPFVSLRGEWPAEALKAATLCYLHVAASLAESGFCLKDAHPWNILFDATTPYVIDWGSIRPIVELEQEFWYRQFHKYFLAPLYLFSIGEIALARALLREHYVGVGNCIIDRPVTKGIPERPYLIWCEGPSHEPEWVFENLADYVASLTIPRMGGEWSDYEQPHLRALIISIMPGVKMSQSMN